MAEAIVRLVVDKLGSLLIHEAVFLRGVSDQVKGIQRELNRMQCFLKDADAKQKGDERIRNWVREVRDVAYDAEDVLDTFILEVAHKRRRGYMGYVRRCTFIFNELIALHKVGNEIEVIKMKIREISESRLTYGIENISRGDEGTSLQEWRRSSPYVEENDAIGLDVDVKTLVARLTKGESRCCLISIVGMGGLGKTTLGKKVYNNHHVKRHFHSRFWVIVSQDYSVRKLLHDMGEKIIGLGREALENINKEDLEKKLFRFLKKRRYLVVMDDVWKNNVWDDVKAIFPDVKNGSRVLITTRNRDVALSADPRSPPHELRFLNNKESWELFVKKVFRSGACCPPELKDVGKKIVAKAGGLPLAILALGGLVSKKDKTPHDWRQVLENAKWELSEGRKQISEILALSYFDLHSVLKPCFLYFSVFPEDSEIRVGRLIRLWIAEGFITMEDVAEAYLEELIDRNMIQVVRRGSHGNVKACRVHDLFRDYAISEAKDNEFSYIPKSEEASRATTSMRRLAIHNDFDINSNRYSALNHFTPRLRSLLHICLKKEVYLGRNRIKSISRSFKLLRVLILIDVSMPMIPEDIGELIHLTYLELKVSSRETEKEIPSSIGNLQNLQTLCLRVTPLYKLSLCLLPNAIWEMPRLRHLSFNELCLVLINHRPTMVSSLNLQTLPVIRAGPWIKDCLGKLISLRKLGISGDLGRFRNAFNDSMVKLTSLRSLKLFSEIITRPSLMSLPRHQFLHKMYLHGGLEKILDTHEFPPNLTKLTLERSKLKEDPLPTLKELPCLTLLNLRTDSYVGEKMVSSAPGFLRLQELTLCGLLQLREWKVEKRAMPNLKRLVIQHCPQLKEVPKGLQHVATLQELELIDMLEEFKSRLAANYGEDYYKIQHIPSVIIKMLGGLSHEKGKSRDMLASQF